MAKKYSKVMSLPAPTPKCSSTTSVMSSLPPLRPDSTKRVRARWAKKVMGKASSARISSGQKPPTPALIGRNRVPAPIAVPYRPRAQVVSWRFQVVEPLAEAGAAECARTLVVLCTSVMGIAL